MIATISSLSYPSSSSNVGSYHNHLTFVLETLSKQSESEEAKPQLHLDLLLLVVSQQRQQREVKRIQPKEVASRDGVMSQFQFQFQLRGQEIIEAIGIEVNQTTEGGNNDGTTFCIREFQIFSE